MENYSHYTLAKIDSESDEYQLILYLNDFSTEFADELGTGPKTKKDIVTTAKDIVKKRYPNMKVTMVKIMIGGLAVTSIPLSFMAIPAEAAVANPNTIQISEQTTSFYHQVEPGNTLWSIASEHNISVDDLKLANNLSASTIQAGQQLIIPQAFHTVRSGDTLYSLANQYGVSVRDLMDANQLTSNTLAINQILIIPITEGTTLNKPAQPAEAASYTVVTGDSLYSIANRYNVTVDAIKNENNLSSNFLSVGQILKIPNRNAIIEGNTETANSTTYMVASGDTIWGIATKFNTSVDAIKKINNLATNTLSIGQMLNIPTENEQVTSVEAPTEPIPPVEETTTHTVKSGETLWGIANRYHVSIDSMKNANNLSTNTLQVGQIVAIPMSNPDVLTESKTNPETKEERATFTYLVKSGDSLSAISNRFNVNVEAIRNANNLKNDTLQIGQALTIPDGIKVSGVNTISYKSHTVVSGDNIWDLSIKYGITQAELLKVNNLTTSSGLSIGQKLKIPVYEIASKQVVSEKHGEYMDWWTEAQYVFTIGKIAKVTDLNTGKSFYIKRTVGANHADSETVTTNDTNIAKSIWGGYSWSPRAVVLEFDGRKIAASMSFMPHEREYIANNGINGHFDVYFGNSTRHKDGKADLSHQSQVERAAGMTQS